MPRVPGTHRGPCPLHDADPPVRDDLPAIDGPTLAVHGTEDRILPIDATARRLPELRVGVSRWGFALRH